MKVNFRVATRKVAVTNRMKTFWMLAINFTLKGLAEMFHIKGAKGETSPSPFNHRKECENLQGVKKMLCSISCKRRRRQALFKLLLTLFL